VTPDDFFRAIPEVIRDIESYDITTIRASVGNWMIAKYIREHSYAKVVFNGDGSDEVLGGYKYFERAPNNESFEDESARLLDEIHMFDVLRSDRCISSHGLEPRTPFLDKQFVEVARSISTIWRRWFEIEKWILRSAFEDDMLLPNEVLWRKKEAFSDGVSGPEKSWYEQIQEYVAPVTQKWTLQTGKYSYLRPKTPEAFYYRELFHTYYGYECQYVIPHMWMPRWSPETSDPSARTIKTNSDTTSGKVQQPGICRTLNIRSPLSISPSQTISADASSNSMAPGLTSPSCTQPSPASLPTTFPIV
jgi:asparagine synthase (glutamine-hydrolysing)